MDQLPNEVLISIFQYLDGKSLSYAERVCHRWNAVLRLPLFELTWQKKCLTELKTSVFYDICDKNDSAASLIYNRNWKLLFAKWFRTRNVKSWPYMKKILPVDFPIQCIACVGNRIVTGHRTGHVLLTQSKLFQIELFKHYKIVSDLKFLEKFTTNEYAVIISTSSDFSCNVCFIMNNAIKASKLLKQHGVPLKSVSCFDNKFVVLAADSTMSLWELSLDKDFNIHIELMQYIFGPNQFVICVSLWRNLDVVCLNTKGQCHHYDVNQKQWFGLSRPVDLILDSGMSIQEDFNVISSYAFQGDVFVMTTTCRQFLINIQGSKMRVYGQMLEHHQTEVTCCNLHGNLMAIGTENGQLLLFHINHTNDLLDLDISQPSFKLTLSEASILAVAISDDGMSPLVTAVTSDAIHLIKWIPPIKKKLNFL